MPRPYLTYSQILTDLRIADKNDLSTTFEYRVISADLNYLHLICDEPVPQKEVQKYTLNGLPRKERPNIRKGRTCQAKITLLPKVGTFYVKGQGGGKRKFGRKRKRSLN